MKLLLEKRNAFHDWRTGAGLLPLFLLSLLLALLTGVMAQVSFTLAWTPVPVTGQTFAVMLAGVIMGPWGALSQILYAVLGFAGIPWFAGMKGGIASLQGPTVGYLLGFILAAYLVGMAVDRRAGFRYFWPLLALMTVVHFFVIMGCGAIYLYGWRIVVKGSAPGFTELMKMSVTPFIPGTIVKVIAAAALSMFILPGKDE